MFRIPRSGSRRSAARPVLSNVERVVERAGSGVALAKIDGALVAYIADEQDARIVVLRVADARMLGDDALGGIPGQIVALPGARLAVAVRDQARVAVLEGAGTNSTPIRFDPSASRFAHGTCPAARRPWPSIENESGSSAPTSSFKAASAAPRWTALRV